MEVASSSGTFINYVMHVLATDIKSCLLSISFFSVSNDPSIHRISERTCQELYMVYGQCCAFFYAY